MSFGIGTRVSKPVRGQSGTLSLLRKEYMLKRAAQLSDDGESVLSFVMEAQIS